MSDNGIFRAHAPMGSSAKLLAVLGSVCSFFLVKKILLYGSTGISELVLDHASRTHVLLHHPLTNLEVGRGSRRLVVLHTIRSSLHSTVPASHRRTYVRVVSLTVPYERHVRPVRASPVVVARLVEAGCWVFFYF
jgi:hypothetical protein